MPPQITIPAQPPSPLPPPLRLELTNALLASSTIPTLQERLLSTSQDTGWLDAVRARSLQLLRSGECATYAEVVGRIAEEARMREGVEKEKEKEREGRRVDVKVPENVVKEGVRVVREALDKVVAVVSQDGEEE